MSEQIDPTKFTQKGIESIFSAAEIAARVEDMADAIVEYVERPLLVEVIMNGAVVFASDLVRALSRRGVVVEIDFIALSSYGTGTTSSGEIVIEADARGAIGGRDVLLVDDILETGRTLAFAKNYFMAKGAHRVMSCVLLDKSKGRSPAMRPDFWGFTCPDLFVIGYGMDYAYRYRELPYIGHLTEEADARKANGAHSSG